MPLTLPIPGNNFKQNGGYFYPLSVLAQDTPNTTVQVVAGSFFNSVGQLVAFPGAPAVSVAPQIGTSVVVGLSDQGVVVTLAGNGNNLPTIPPGILPLAAIFPSSPMYIGSEDIVDVRPLFQTTPSVSGIVGASLTLNSGGQPLATNASVVVNRGAGIPAVAVRWNIYNNSWEFTNDGTNYLPIAAQVAPPLPSTNIQTGTSYTIALTDAPATTGYSGTIFTNSPVANTITVPTNSTVPFPVGTRLSIIQIGVGPTTLVGATGVTLNSQNPLVTPGQFSTIALTYFGSDTWIVSGSTV